MKFFASISILAILMALVGGCVIYVPPEPEPESDPPEIVDVAFTYTSEAGMPLDPVIDIMACEPWGGWEDSDLLSIWVKVDNRVSGTEYQVSADSSALLSDPWAEGYLTPTDGQTGRMPVITSAGWVHTSFMYCDAYGPGQWLLTAWLDGDASVNNQQVLFITPYQPPA